MLILTVFSKLSKAQPGPVRSDSAHKSLYQLKLPEEPKKTIQPLRPTVIFDHWGVFCWGEYRLQQKTGLPLRFRLGSLEYVNALEGKGLHLPRQ